MSRGKTGYINSARMRGVVPYLDRVPSVLFPPNMDAYGVFEDFIGWPTLAAAANANGWQWMEQNAGTLTQADEAGGVVMLATGGADNDASQMIMGGSAAGGAFWAAADKDIYFEARAKMSNLGVARTNIFVGLVDPVAAIILPNDGGAMVQPNFMGFVVQDTDAVFSFMGDKATIQDKNSLAVAIDTSYHYFGFVVHGVTSVDVYLDRVLIAAGALATANIPVLGLMPVLCVKAGSGVVESLSADYVMAVQMR